MELSYREQLLKLQSEMRSLLRKRELSVGISLTEHFIERTIHHIEVGHFCIADVKWLVREAVTVYATALNTVGAGKVHGHFVDAERSLDMPFVVQPDTTKRYNMVLLPKSFVKRSAGRIEQGNLADGHPLYQVR